MDSKLSFITDYERGGLSFAELCRRHEISRKTGYKWLNRYKLYGEQGLDNASRRPHCSPRRSSTYLEQLVVSIRKEHPAWGGRKIRRILQNQGVNDPLPAASTITGILRRHGLIGAGMREGAKDIQRFERNEPNDLWQMDFKGWFQLHNRRRCYPLTILDDHSRYNIALEACSGENGKVVKPLLIKAFKRYGLPRQILCDHGCPWGKGLNADGAQIGTPKLEAWLMRLGVEVIHGRVRHPQTQGKEERFHRTLKVEVLDQEYCWKDHRHCQDAFDQWQWVYNQKRPHESLAMNTPSSRYVASHRSYPSELPAEESYYLPEDVLRKVKSKGEITFKNHFFYIGQAYVDSPVALRHRAANKWDVYYCWKHLGTINLLTTWKKKGRYHSIKGNL